MKLNIELINKIKQEACRVNREHVNTQIKPGDVYVVDTTDNGYKYHLIPRDANFVMEGGVCVNPWMVGVGKMI